MRLMRRYQESGAVRERRYRRNRFASRYTTVEIRHGSQKDRLRTNNVSALTSPAGIMDDVSGLVEGW